MADIFYSGIEDYVVENVRETAKEISHGLGWEYRLGPVIPAAISIKFLINTAGNELLESVNIRKLLADRVHTIVSESDIVEFLQNNGFSELMEFKEFFVKEYSPRSR